MADEYGTAIRYRIMRAARIPNSRMTTKVQDEIMQLCVDPEVEHKQENEQGSSCCAAMAAPLPAAVPTATDAAIDTAADEAADAAASVAAAAATATTAVVTAAEHQCVSTMCMDEENRQQRPRRRTPSRVAIPAVFESTPVPSSANKNHKRNTALNRIGFRASAFENVPTPSSADAVASSVAAVPSAAATNSSLEQSTFESKPMQSTADASLAECNHCGPLSDEIFERAPTVTAATVTHAETLEVASSDKDQHIFESQPLQSFASVRHGERPTVERDDTPIVFESMPVASKAHAKAGVDGVADSESEYETDEDTCEPLDSEEETTAEEI